MNAEQAIDAEIKRQEQEQELQRLREELAQVIYDDLNLSEKEKS